MPRRQRFKPSRKPKPAIEPSDQDVVVQASTQDPTIDPQSRDLNVGRATTNDIEDRVPR